MDSADDNRDEVAPLNIMEYTFSEKMLFVNTTQIKKFKNVYGGIQKKDIKPFVLLSICEMEGRIPKVGGIPNISDYVAVRTLVTMLYREAQLAEKHRPPTEELYKYLISINLQPECCRELLNCLLAPDVFSNVPKEVTTFPHIVSFKYIIDLTSCKQDMSNFKRFPNDDDKESTVTVDEYLREAIRIIVFMKLSDGKENVFSMKWSDLANFRYTVSEALRSAEELNVKIHETEKTHRENLRLMLAEGQL